MSKHPHKHKKFLQRRRHKLRHSHAPQGFDGCPVSPIVHAVLTDCREHGINFTVISGDRRNHVAQRFGHSSQKQLWDCYQAYLATGHCNCGSCNPANPPGHSTHEYRDGSGSYPYGRPDGAKLAPWMLGLDLASNEEASAFCAAANRLGYTFFQPYNTGSELHHVNLRHNPLPTLKKRNRA